MKIWRTLCANISTKNPRKILQNLLVYLGSADLSMPKQNLILLDFNHLFLRAQAAHKSIKQVLQLLPKMVENIADLHPKNVLIFASKYREQFQTRFEALGWMWIHENKWKGDKRCDVDPILITETMDRICSDPESIQHLYLEAGDKDYVGIITAAKKRGILTTVWAFEAVDVAQEVFETAKTIEYFT